MEMKCEAVCRNLSDYIDGELEQTENVMLERHLADCPQCRALLASTRNIILLYRDPRTFEMPAGVRERLRARLAKEVAPPRRQFLAWMLTAAATVPMGVALYSARKLLLHPLNQDGKLFLSSIVAVSQDPQDRLFHIKGCPKLQGNPRLLTIQEALREGYAADPACVGSRWQQE